MTDIVSYLFSGVVVAGGIMGYVKAGSIMSLSSGVLFGSLLAYGAYRVSNNPRDFMFLLVVSGVLCGVMGMRFYRTHKFMPAGLVALLSLLQVVRLAVRFNQ